MIRPYRLFFGAASALMVLSLLVWGAQRAGAALAFGPIHPGQHARDLLAGFLPMAMAGFLLGRSSRALCTALVLSWLIARALQWGMPWSPWTMYADIPVLLLLIVAMVPRQLRARKWRNRAFGAMVLLALMVSLAWWFASRAEALKMSAMLAILLLMGFVSARQLGPAAARAMRERGRHCAHATSRFSESLLALAAVILPLTLLPTGSPFIRQTVAMALIVSVLWHWFQLRLWRWPANPYLYAVLGGQCWLIAAAGSYLPASPNPLLTYHLAGIGAMGTLASVTMLRVHRLRLGLDRPGPGKAYLVLLMLTSLAALTRTLVLMTPLTPQANALVIALLVAAFGLVLTSLLNLPAAYRQAAKNTGTRP